MMSSCLVCLERTKGSEDYHPKCLEALFGTKELPSLDVELSELYKLAATKMAGKMSISGAQEKVSLVLSPDKKSLEVAATGGQYILKPEGSRFSAVPQNEHLTMQMARTRSIEVPEFGLMRLKEGSIAYVVKRFDRTDDGGKLPVEDFNQLAMKKLRDKYNGSGEECAKIIRKYTTETVIEMQKFYRLMLFSWWMANGDMHMKNFSLITDDGICKLSPAYDLVCTELVIPGDTLAMPVGGRVKNFTRRKWLNFAEYCEIPKRAAERLLTEQIDALASSIELISKSLLSQEMKERYAETIRANTAILNE